MNFWLFLSVVTSVAFEVQSMSFFQITLAATFVWFFGIALYFALDAIDTWRLRRRNAREAAARYDMQIPIFVEESFRSEDVKPPMFAGASRLLHGARPQRDWGKN